MTYRSIVLEDGHIDLAYLPPLPPGTPVEVSVPKTVESLRAMLEELAQIGRESSQEIYSGSYNREVIYEDHD